MSIPMNLHPDRLFPADPTVRTLARSLYATVKDLPIVSPHGHTDPQWFADDTPFANASALFITPDHYAFRMLYSQGVRLEDLGIPRRDGAPVEQDARKIWCLLIAATSHPENAAHKHARPDEGERQPRVDVGAGDLLRGLVPAQRVNHSAAAVCGLPLPQVSYRS